MNRGDASWLGLLEHARSLDPDPGLAHLTDAELQREVRDGASRLAALECQWLLQVGELVVRGVWADEGARTPGQWLSFTCGLDGSTAREKCRVALALRDLPRIRSRFADGTLSYSKVRAMTRVATPEIEDRLILLADSAPASHLVRLLAAGRRSADELLAWQDGPPERSDGDVRDLQRLVAGDGVVEYRVRVPADEALAIDERLDRLVDAADRAERADRASADAPRPGPCRSWVTTGRGRGMMLPRRVLARLACDADLRLAGTRDDGHPADIGRRSRHVPADLRRALTLRDRHCRFPGCHTTRGLHAHHVVHWALGGPTDLANLTLLCAHHHRFVHDRGWSLRPVSNRPGRWTFHAPGSEAPLEAVRPMPGASADAPAGATDADPPPLALQPPWWDGGPYDPSETVRIISDMLLDVAA